MAARIRHWTVSEVPQGVQVDRPTDHIADVSIEPARVTQKVRVQVDRRRPPASGRFGGHRASDTSDRLAAARSSRMTSSSWRWSVGHQAPQSSLTTQTEHLSRSYTFINVIGGA